MLGVYVRLLLRIKEVANVRLVVNAMIIDKVICILRLHEINLHSSSKGTRNRNISYNANNTININGNRTSKCNDITNAKSNSIVDVYYE